MKVIDDSLELATLLVLCDSFTDHDELRPHVVDIEALDQWPKGTIEEDDGAGPCMTAEGVGGIDDKGFGSIIPLLDPGLRVLEGGEEVMLI